MSNQLRINFENDTIEESMMENSLYNWCIANDKLFILEEWDYEKNGDITPKNISPGSDKVVWWKKPYDDPRTGKHFDFSWKSSISHRKDGRGCPYLSKPVKKIYVGFNDLCTTHPQLAEEWDKEANDKLNIKITEVTYGSTKDVFWKCKIHGSYKARIASRAADGNGCPYCSGKQVKQGYNDLKTLRPDIAKEWDYEKNNIGPESVTIGCTKKYWWKCSKGHSWDTTPNHRTSGANGCPYCANKKVLSGYNDLETLYPLIAGEWNYKRNGNITPRDVLPKSNKAAWWKCVLGHEYHAKIYSRTLYDTGCPKCNSEFETSFQEQCILFYMKQSFSDTKSRAQFDWLGNSEIDIYIPSLKLGIEYDGGFWHRNIEKDIKKDLLCKKNGIKLIRVRDSSCPDYESSSIIIKHKKKNADETFKEVLIIIFEIINNEYGMNNEPDINIDRDYAKIVSSFIFGEKENSLAKSRPDIAAKWDRVKNGNITPNMISLHSNKKFWFICPKCNNSYMMMVNKIIRRKRTDCPTCSGKVKK